MFQGLQVVNLPGLGSGFNTNFTRGKKFFELSNHLGNVLATVSDGKVGVSTDSTTIDHYEADIISAQEYYSFGMQMPGRGYSSDKYRYGFNGKENDNEVKGDGNQQDYGFRIYDPRVGRFLSVDPLAPQYPELTSYQFASNRPIDGIDLDGLEYSPASAQYMRDNTAVLRMPSMEEIQAVQNYKITQAARAAEAARSAPLRKAQLSQDYSQTIWGSKGGFEASKKMLETEAGFVPGGTIGIKMLKGEKITTTDVVVEAAITFIPVGKIFRGLKGGGKEVLEQVVHKTDNIAAHLTEKDISGAIRDINGDPVIIDGYVYDHLDEVTNAIKGLENQINKLNKAIDGGKVTREVLDAAKKIRSNIQTQKDKIQAVLDRAENAVKRAKSE